MNEHPSSKDFSQRMDKIKKDISESYHYECTEGAKYARYSIKAKKLGHESLSNFFEACSFSEIIHATELEKLSHLLNVHLDPEVEPCPDETLEEIVEEVIRDEERACEKYPEYDEDVEGVPYAPLLLMLHSNEKADESHKDLCEELKNADDFWDHETKHFRVCPLCGYIRKPSGDPCPVCGTSADKFVRFPKTDEPDKPTQAPHKEHSDSSPHKDWRCDRVFPNKLDPALGFFTEVTTILAERGWSEEDQFAINLALTEAAVNAVEHGNNNLPDKRVYVEMVISDDFFYCSIHDEGEGFNPDSVPDPSQEEYINRTSGRGIKLINGFMSRVWFNEKGNAIKMAKSPS